MPPPVIRFLTGRFRVLGNCLPPKKGSKPISVPPALRSQLKRGMRHDYAGVVERLSACTPR